MATIKPYLVRQKILPDGSVFADYIALEGDDSGFAPGTNFSLVSEPSPPLTVPTEQLTAANALLAKTVAELNEVHDQLAAMTSQHDLAQAKLAETAKELAATKATLTKLEAPIQALLGHSHREIVATVRGLPHGAFSRGTRSLAIRPWTARAPETFSNFSST